MIHSPNLDGLRYFIYQCTISQKIPFLPREVREIIWNMSEKKSYIVCVIDNNIEVRLDISVNVN